MEHDFQKKKKKKFTFPGSIDTSKFLYLAQTDPLSQLSYPNSLLH